MSGSRKSRKNAAVFNSRASNEWSKDESKIGQRMLEKMGWKQGQGIGLNNQGITENIKVRLKLDSKGLGYQIKEDQWLEVRSEFSDLLSQLSQGVEGEDETLMKEKKSLEAVSQSSKTRVHYHKFTHGKDIARYKKEDLIGILGKKEKEESKVSENKEFIHSGNMDEYFKSKKKKSKGSDLDFSSEKNLTVDDQGNNSNMEPVPEDLTSNLHASNSNSRKRKKSVKTSSNDDENERSSENNSMDENSTVQNTGNTKDEELDNNNSNSRKRKKSVKTSNKDIEDERLSENKSEDISTVQSTGNAKDEEQLDDTDHIPRKKTRNSDCPTEVTHQKNDFGIESVHEKNTDDSTDSNLSQKRKKSSKKLQNKNEAEELKKNEPVDEKAMHQQIEKTKNDVLNLPRQKKKRDKNNTSPLHVEFEPKLTNDNEGVENDCINLQIEGSSDKKKKKSAKKSDEGLSRDSTEENKNEHESEERNEDHENDTYCKKEENSFVTDSKSNEASTPLEVTDDSPCKLKKKKHKRKKLTDICLDVDKNKKVLDKLGHNSEDFMKSVIDYNSSNNVEDYISKFEKNRDELMNKYRERYRMKYSMCSSGIQVYGDEFDGRKLDCIKSDSEELCVMKTVDRKNMSKAERIVAKARLLKSIKDKTITHNFAGSNLTNVLGYGNIIC